RCHKSFFLTSTPRTSTSSLFPYTTLFRSKQKEYLLDLPRELRDVLAKINKERIGIELNMPKVSIFLNKLDRISNRLSFSVILLRSEEHTSELQSRENLVCRLLLEKKKLHA